MVTITIDDNGELNYSGDLRAIMKQADAHSAAKAIEVSAGIVSLVKNAALEICLENVNQASGGRNEKFLKDSLLQVCDGDPEEFADFQRMYKR